MNQPRERYLFKRKLEEIESAEGRGTELVSLYVPPNRRISDVTSYLKKELSQSSNIKSKTTRKNVTSAIESILGRLKSYRVVPENGLVFFVGETEAGADQTETASHVVEPPESVTTFLYRCDSRFHTEPLREMLREKELYGLMVIDRSEATLGLLRGKRIEVIKNVQSLVPSKHSKGGQSARRFERLIEQAAHVFFVKVGNLMTEALLDMRELKGILLGGPGYTKDFFLEKDYIHHELKRKVIDTFDLGYADESGLRELVEKARKTLADLDLMREKRLMQAFLEEVKRPDEGLAVYGEAEIRRALELGAVDTLLISEAIRKVRMGVSCPVCGYQGVVTAESVNPGQCPKCGADLSMDEKVDLVEDLHDKAERLGTKVELISEDSEEGKLFWRAFAGLGGILRYRVS
ncbi:MAG: peptide chain release factor aRF-1 [Candidatus Thermoplasmatota archaeon]|nr:peptide chain release factor aRF-1 [Candidatus Thermoplasmatota archaeon]